MKAVPSTTHGMIKFPVMGGILTLRSSKIIPIECAMVSGPEDQPPPMNKVNTKGIKISPDKVDTVLSLRSPTCLKDVQKLNGKLASLNRRIRGTHYLPGSVQGSGERRTHDRKGGKADANLLYQPIKNVLSNPEVAGRMQKWSIQLGEFGIHYRPRVSVKGQVLADFIVERPEEEGQDDSAREEEPLPARWTLFTDRSSCVDGCGAGVILTDSEGMEFTYALRFQFETTNNEAEYEALIAGLRIAEKMGVKNLEVNVDSKLVANQVNGTYIAKETDMVKYLEKVKALTNTFRAFSIKQVPRSKNKKADALSKMASTSFAHLSKQVLVEELKEKSVNEKEVLAVVEEEGDT
ncbi:reverse transcriptase domain-containing protein [Tanacetum coccineum]